MRHLLLVLATLAATSACDFDLERMNEGQRLKPYQETPYLPGNRVAQRPPDGTVPTSRIVGESELTEGLLGGAYVDDIPVEITRDTLERGRNRYEIFCGACHGISGEGNRQVAENMRLRPPPSLHEARIAAYPPGRLYRVIARGYGLMPAYAEELSVADRWAVVAYVQALQLSQRADLGGLPEGLREEASEWLN